MFKINRTDVIDTDLYDERINHTGFILYDRKSIEADVAYYRAHADTCYDLARMRMLYRSGNQCCFMKRECILDYLIDYEGCPESFFKAGKTKGLSLDSKRVLAVLREKGYAQEFIDNYIEYKSWGAKCSKLESILASCTELVAKSKFGRDLYKLPFVASLETNRRFNYNNFDIISQIPKTMANCIGVEDGYFLAWGDFAQSDFRIAYNLFLRSPENDKIIMKYPDRYEALARMVAEKKGEPFDYEKFKNERQLYKQNILATIYGKRNSNNEEEARFINLLSEFVDSMPAYSNYNALLEEYASLGLPIRVESYFGYVQQIRDDLSFSKNTMRYEALNTPVQTGSSEIVISVVNSILNKCYEAGYSEDDISLYMTRHDEPIFRIKETAKGVLPILLDHSTVIVDDWSPLQLDWNLGYNYKVPDEDLEKELAEIAETFVETQVSTEAVCDTSYTPLKAVMALGIAKRETPDGKTIVTFYNKAKNEVIYSMFLSNNTEDVDNECKLKIRDMSKAIYDLGYGNLVVFSQFLSDYDYFNGLTIYYDKVESDEISFSAKRLCDLMTWRYCKKNGLEPVVAKPVFTTYDSWIESVKDMSYLLEG